jgi:hypothetical protein
MDLSERKLLRNLSAAPARQASLTALPGGKPWEVRCQSPRVNKGETSNPAVLATNGLSALISAFAIPRTVKNHAPASILGQFRIDRRPETPINPQGPESARHLRYTNNRRAKFDL